MKNSIQFLILLLISSVLLSCLNYKNASQKDSEYILPKDRKILIAAHRGDWRNSPENSLQAIENCIKMGINIVEFDVRMTKDSVLVIMHDETIDRTTNGSGFVSELSIEYLKTLYLKDGLGFPTKNKIPTLSEALAVCDNKIMVNIDKAYDFLPMVFSIVEKMNLENKVIFKGWGTKYQDIYFDKIKILNKINFMPIVDINKSDWLSVIKSYDSKYKPYAYELIFENDSTLQTAVNEIKKQNSKVWINALWPKLNAGHDDEKAVYDIDQSYGWLIKSGADIIQTDRPGLLKSYLDK